MFPMDTDTMVALRIEDLVRSHRADELAREARQHTRCKRGERDAERPTILWLARQMVGQALIRVGVWLSAGGRRTVDHGVRDVFPCPPPMLAGHPQRQAPSTQS